MAGVAEAVGLIPAMISIADHIMQLAETAKRNRENCTQIKDRVLWIKGLLWQLKRMPDLETESVLKNLEDALNDGKALVESCQEKRTWSLVFKTQEMAKKFATVDAEISKILEQFHIANMILLVCRNKELFFMDVLEKLLQDGACTRLQQEVKEELKSSIKNLTNMNNMSSEAKRLLEWITKDITQADDAAMPVSPGGRGGEGASSTGNDEEAEIVRLALSVVQEAKAVRHKRAGIQQLVQFTQQLADLMQQLQSLGLSQDDVTLSNLKKLLQKASRTVSPNEQRRNNKRMAQDDNILEVAYRIEYFVQILPFIAMRDV